MCCSNKLSEGKYKELEEFIKLHNNNEAHLIVILHKAQELFGYLPREVQVFISKKLGIPYSKVYGVVTFYSFFSTTAKGKYVINVCKGTACFVRGAGEILEEFEKKLEINQGETTQDGKYTIDTLRCVGACGLAPVVSVNGKVYGHFNKKDVDKLIQEYSE
ncbi:complex I 24 kDa subunit family protein [Clostridium cellulovorans]|uniref:NADH dehydrogenase (Ubiquinone) 24 kDa subunit n=1 Tax=Clostridium cellulovorans (strain ATCC 35296 / DSM 3052 / OCM 3 / 743B) TaxID=573061 RepID=D9SP19_CLOC7|nr:NAD(P)H-dependent oxidoreductase subunit E [Clostridium cellulovorans]ADL51984.1 NADH dehydrogenase (ubiquinone) 24 kDa subunit [Clostridium cellulovorans 743B]